MPRILLALCLLALAACGPGLTPTPHPTPTVLSIQTTITLRPLGEMFDACILDLPNAGLVVEETSAPALNPAQADIALRWGLEEQPQSFAAEVGREALAVVVHPHNPITSIALADLNAVYSGDLREWMQPASGDVHPWGYPAGEDVQQVFEAVARGSQSIPERSIYLAPDPAAMIESVAQDPGAVGFLPRRWLDERVKEIAVEGLEPENLTRPIVAMSSSEPTGQARAWLLCVQEQLSE